MRSVSRLLGMLVTLFVVARCAVMPIAAEDPVATSPNGKCTWLLRKEDAGCTVEWGVSTVIDVLSDGRPIENGLVGSENGSSLALECDGRASVCGFEVVCRCPRSVPVQPDASKAPN